MARPVVQNKGARVNGHLSLQATAELHRIMDEYGTSKYDILNTAIVFYAKTMRGENSFMPSIRQPNKVRSKAAQDILSLKSIWCQEAGGECDGNMCHFTKYEMTLAGTVDGMDRTIPLNDMPDTREEFLGYVLGGFDNVEQAKAAATQDQS